MTRSTKTIAELRTMAMLLGPGWWYDMSDHTFCLEEGVLIMAKALDADTLELIYDVDQDQTQRQSMSMVVDGRRKQVAVGQIGAADYD